jgi:hypothetical protein
MIILTPRGMTSRTLQILIVLFVLSASCCALIPPTFCDEPGTPNHERATAISPNAIRLDWNNTAYEANIYFDIEGKNDRSIANVGPFDNGRDKPVSYTVNGLATGQQHCFRMWARIGPNGCRSQVPSAWACATPLATSSGGSSGSPQPPTISVSTPQPNTFTISGSSFRGSTAVHLRVVDDALAQRYFNQTSGPDGRLSMTLNSLCVNPGQLHFSANDGRQNPRDVTGTLWSNTVTATCSGSGTLKGQSLNIPPSGTTTQRRRIVHGMTSLKVESPICVQGYVWREATPNDHTCVAPSVREQAQVDNRLAQSRIRPTDHSSGPDTCITGFVWREATPDDHVCVSPGVREQAKQDNAHAQERMAH